jgi:hypothetical protein
MTVMGMTGRDVGVASRMGALVQPDRMRFGRTKSDVRHILLLPAGLAGGLGREVLCPTASLCGFAPKNRVPRFSDGVSENSAVSLRMMWLTISNGNLFFRDVKEIDHISAVS